MGRGKMDEAAAERIKKARGEKVWPMVLGRWSLRVTLTGSRRLQQDDFSRRAAIAARANKENAGQGQGGGQGASTDGKQGSGGSSKK